jgi:hypothetical protein
MLIAALTSRSCSEPQLPQIQERTDNGISSAFSPQHEHLEGRFQLILANAAHIKAVPGRKSDTHDATWISDLLAHGLIRASFVPPQPIQEVRDLTDQEATDPGDRAAHPAHPRRSTRVRKGAPG